MRKKYLLVAGIFIIAFISIYFLFQPSKNTFSSFIESFQNQGNKTNPSNFEPSSQSGTSEGSGEKSSGTGSTGSAGSEGGTGGGGSESSGGIGGSSEEPPVLFPKKYISMSSSPEGLKIFASYYIDGKISSFTSNTPFNLEADPNSFACFLPASITSNGVLKWIVDEQDCQFSTCEMSSYNRTETLYSDYGCLVNMNENHSIALQFTPY